MDSDKYGSLEKRFHKYPDKDLRVLCTDQGISHGTAATVCKSFVEKFGMSETELLLESYEKDNNVELVSSAYLDYDDFDKSVFGPVKFLDIRDSYAPSEDLECKLVLDDDFVKNISRRDWIGIFEKNWKYLYSYWTFEWVTKVEAEGDDNVMVVRFSSRTLPINAKEYMFCYVTRTGEVLGRTDCFTFRNPGLSFTDPDTFLVQDEPASTLPTGDLKSIVMLSSYNEDEKEKWNAEREELSYQLSSKSEEILTLQDKVDELKSELLAKNKSQEVITNDYDEKLRELEKKLGDIKIESQQMEATKKALETELDNKSQILLAREKEILHIRKRLDDTESTMGELIGENLNKASISQSVPSEELLECQKERDRLKNDRDGLISAFNSERAHLDAKVARLEGDLARLTELVRHKDEALTKLTLSKQECEATSLTYRSDATKYRDDYKRLMDEMTSCIKKLDEAQQSLKHRERENVELQARYAESTVIMNENNTLKQQIQALENKLKQMEVIRLSMGRDEDMTIAQVLSLQARIAHLEHLNSRLEAQKSVSNASQIINSLNVVLEQAIQMVPSNYRSMIIKARDDIPSSYSSQTKAEPEVKPAPVSRGSEGSGPSDLISENVALKQELAEVREREKMKIAVFEQKENNFREGIKDLRGQLVAKTLEVEKKNSLLADKGELIDSLRLEAQERVEGERYLKHQKAQLEKKLKDESDTFYQVISDMQSQLNAFHSSYQKYDQNRLIKCPFCPAAYEASQQQLLEEHVQRRHPVT